MFFKVLSAVLVIGPLVPCVLADCNPDCIGKNIGDKVEDPRDCTKYYICLDHEMPSDVSVPCEGDSHFNASMATCIPGKECDSRCIPGTCHLTCEGDIDVISDYFNCSVFKFCVNGMVVGTGTCPPDKQYFDGEICVNDMEQCCSLPCNAYCPGYGVQIVDPYDCKAFFLCLSEGFANETGIHGNCGGGEVFDVTAGHCVSGGSCTSICGDDTDTPITITTTSSVTPPSTPKPGTSTPKPGSTPNTPDPDTTTTTTPTTTTDSICQTNFLCPSGGFFPQCMDCQPGYFACDGAGQQGQLKQCENGYVFNTNPSFPYCISPTHCPFFPLKFLNP